MQIINNNIECETNVEFIVECMAAHWHFYNTNITFSNILFHISLPFVHIWQHCNMMIRMVVHFIFVLVFTRFRSHDHRWRWMSSNKLFVHQYWNIICCFQLKTTNNVFVFVCCILFLIFCILCSLLIVRLTCFCSVKFDVPVFDAIFQYMNVFNWCKFCSNGIFGELILSAVCLWFRLVLVFVLIKLQRTKNVNWGRTNQQKSTKNKDNQKTIQTTTNNDSYTLFKTYQTNNNIYLSIQKCRSMLAMLLISNIRSHV
jgi:hypothetical protein